MPKTDSITQARLKELLHYDPETGDFTWVESRIRHAKKGAVVGTTSKHRYIKIKIDGAFYNAHRLAFLYMLGYMPDEVDHDDQVRSNNRWNNLNPTTRAINGKNQPLHCDNTSGTCGVCWHKGRKKWYAYINVNKKHTYLGLFTHKSDAIAARQAADIKYGYHDNHGAAKSNSSAKPEVR